MKELVKTLEEYKEWKSKIKMVLDDNFCEIAELISEAHGKNIFVEIKKTRTRGRGRDNPRVIINRDIPNGNYLIWYYRDGELYLITRGEENFSLDIRPDVHLDSDRMFVRNTPLFKAKIENEVDFVIDLLGWAEELIEVLQEKMNRNTPPDVRRTIEDTIRSIGNTYEGSPHV